MSSASGRSAARAAAFMLLALATSGCGETPRSAKAPGAEKAPKAAATGAAATAQGEPAAAQPQQFGAPIDPATPELRLAELLAAPAEHAGKKIRTQGTIERVCQKMGCWMEIRDEGAPSAVRVPMAGHAFFLPQSVAGKRCTLEGEVSVEPLTEAQKRHLEAEGAQATEVAVSIVASGVRVP